MGLIARYRKRCDVWRWRARYWLLDTRAGRIAQLAGAGCAFLGLVAIVVRMAMVAALPPDPTRPRQAFSWLVFWIVTALIAAVVLAIGSPKPAKPAEEEAKAPTSQDGKSAVRYYGTNWVEQPAMLAWKVVGRDPIKTKSGKK